MLTRRAFLGAFGLLAAPRPTWTKFSKARSSATSPSNNPPKFELVINLKTAKALGLKIPQSLLQRAGELIQ